MNKADKSILTKSTIERLEKLLVVFPEKKSIVLPALHLVYEQFGYLNKAAIAEIAARTGVPDIYFEEGANFYTMFPIAPVGKYLIQVCHNISCTLMGADELVRYLKEKLKIEVGETTADGLFTLVTVECLGSCGTAPVMQINDTYYENLTREKVDRILEKLRRQE
ncbi:MAG: NADH-quinone oxidoreductase subunit NuoE [candidate division Zixibacteria bacterium]|nr:NADH-quinone oxidoreductase subunit NuoE [candidate division Zixibacteria bacterium]